MTDVSPYVVNSRWSGRPVEMELTSGLVTTVFMCVCLSALAPRVIKGNDEPRHEHLLEITALV